MRTRQRSDQVSDGTALSRAAIEELQSTVLGTNVRNTGFQQNCLVLMAQRDSTALARCRWIQKIEPHALNADVYATGWTRLICNNKLSRKVN